MWGPCVRDEGARAQRDGGLPHYITGAGRTGAPLASIGLVPEPRLVTLRSETVERARGHGEGGVACAASVRAVLWAQQPWSADPVISGRTWSTRQLFEHLVTGPQAAGGSCLVGGVKGL